MSVDIHSHISLEESFLSPPLKPGGLCGTSGSRRALEDSEDPGNRLQKGQAKDLYSQVAQSRKPRVRLTHSKVDAASKGIFVLG